ncbi:MAG TPA: glycosyltransferase [Terriglobia bacterium]
METPDSQPGKALFLLPSLGGGGAERVVLTLARHLDRTRFEPHVAVLENKGAYVDSLPEDVSLHDLAARRVRYCLPALVRLIRRLRPAVILSNIGELNLVLLFCRPLLPRGVRLLVRETVVVSAWLAQEVKHPGIVGAMYPRLYPRADQIICQCDAMLRDLERNLGVPGEKMVRVYNPVDFERVRTLAESEADPYSGPGPHLVGSGRFIPMKGFDLLLQAMAEVARARPSADLTILGQGALEGELKALAGTLGIERKVRFEGFQPNPYPWMKHADLFALSSRYEGLPNVMLEALALGTPVVGTDCPGGVREILETCPIGRVAPNEDPHALAGAIIAALDSGLKSRPAPGLAEFLDRFRVERIVRQYEEVLSPPGARH